jgi:hypothetical protein
MPMRRCRREFRSGALFRLALSGAPARRRFSCGRWRGFLKDSGRCSAPARRRSSGVFPPRCWAVNGVEVPLISAASPPLFKGWIMDIATRLKRLFRRPPQGSLVDLVDVLASLEREARNLAEQTFEIALGFPPRSRERSKERCSRTCGIRQLNNSEQWSTWRECPRTVSPQPLGYPRMFFPVGSPGWRPLPRLVPRTPIG